MTTAHKQEPGFLRYGVCGRTVLSDLPLPGLPAKAAGAPSEQPAILLLAAEPPLGPPPSDPFLSLFRPTGERRLAGARWNGGYRLSFPGQAEVFVEPDRRTVRYTHGAGLRATSLAQLLVSQVLPLVLNLQGADLFHAAAVLTPAGPCAFVGPSGSGKSTLAASFQTAGCPVLSDDYLVVEERDGRILGVFGPTALDLLPDSADALRRAGPAHGRAGTEGDGQVSDSEEPGPAGEPRPLRRLYYLDRTSTPAREGRGTFPRIESCAARESILLLLGCLIRLDTSDSDMLVRQLDLLHRLVLDLPVRRLLFPDSFTALPLVRQAILADLAAREEQT